MCLCRTQAKKFGFAGWSLDVEPTVPPSGSGSGKLANYSQFLTTFSARLAAHGLRLSTAEPNGNLINTTVVGSDPRREDYSGYYALGHAGAEVTTMNTYCTKSAVPDPFSVFCFCFSVTHTSQVFCFRFI